MEELTVKIQNGKIYAPLKDKWLDYKPEEEVRQKYVCRLVNNYGYSLEQMAQELKVTNSQRGQGAARADIVVWKTPKDKTEDKVAFIVVECKAQNVTIKNEDYFQGYNYAAWAGADFFVTTNQKETRVFRVNKGKLPKALEEIAEIPDAKDALDKKKIEQLLTQTKSFTREEFSRLLFKCHNIIRNNDKLSPEAAFDEISKILFMKIRYERQNSDSQIFSSNEFEKLESAYNSIKSKDGKPFYQNLFDRTKEDFAKDNLFEDNEAIKIRENSFKQIVKELEIYNLSTTSDDVKGIAFEQFLGRTFRGELGQFFTPRTIVDFMVEILDPQEGELICDPCCGSGGFLIKAFEYVREKIEQDIEHQKDLLKQQSFDDNYEKLSDSKKKEIEKQVDSQFVALNKHLDINNINGRLRSLSFDCIYGTDANPRMARTAKMNMIMHGDGHGGVHHHDGLLNVNGIWENRFDVIITNPPFGARVNEDLLITESDKFTDAERIKYYTERYGQEYLKAQSQVNDRIGMPVLYLYNVGRELNCGLTEVLFIERCLNLLKPGGRMGIVLPEGVLNGSNLQKVRDYFESIAKILLVVSLPQEVFLASGATVKTSLMFFKKFTTEERRQYDDIKAEATKTVDDKYKDELERIETELKKNGRLTKEQSEKYKKHKKEIEKKISDRAKVLISDINANKRNEFVLKYANELTTIIDNLKNKDLTDDDKTALKEQQKNIKKQISDDIRKSAYDSANKEFEEELAETESYKQRIEQDCPSREERKKLEQRKNEIAELKKEDVLQIVKEKFNYEFIVTGVYSAGINSLGRDCDNDLIPLCKEFTEYRKENNLWQPKMPADICENTKVTFVNV